ncbi:MAG TPA: transcriptional regulator [Afipia sp.]|uniref:winged helix-turn-helix transcriptional regulator n=1 Tax=unclassified Afipia TaxID=2642050 RepID=UPI000464D4C8|nr:MULTISPECIES: helix-turn-helix domain-containing protein [unclassified Afipia]MAH69738.1 transcriptional regulator [Afipia sp.]OUX61152.1 MAG: transcriptional regulator [Afipia sp. TMED4]HAO39009.1 transcriptional regulator [Afipia sp.]HAP09307.1 transcriptional regulator [Afipia sp.]HAP47279.1 transcriptional regulator [Afipia sp.]
MKRKSLEGDVCPIARTLDAIGDWWSLLIVRDALMGARRFSQFQKNLGVAKNILAVRLRTLVAQGILEVKPASDGSAYQDYVPTTKARALFPVLVAMRQWGEEYAVKPGESCSSMVDKQDGLPLSKLQILAHDGRPIDQADTKVIGPAAT